MSEAAIRLHAVEFPAAYLYHAQAAVILEQWDKAEKSAREAVRLDTEREYPLSRYLLAVLLDRKGETSEARAYFVQYLAMVPNAKDAAAIRQRINALETEAK
jgi:Flp pilus assembly protein TadD